MSGKSVLYQNCSKCLSYNDQGIKIVKKDGVLACDF